MRTSKMSKHRKNLALLMIAIMGFAQMNGILCVGSYAGQAEPLPAKYDMRELGLVTSAKAQGKINGCWAFASLGSLESNVRKLEKKDLDFSENSMLSQHGFDIGAADGGNMYMATAYLANWKGAILEKNDPYSRNSVVESRGTFPSDYKVQDVLFLEPRKNFKDNETIKNAIVTYGGVYSNLKWDDAGYHTAKNSYFNNSLKGYDHTVTIVGWDDYYAKENFGNQKHMEMAHLSAKTVGVQTGVNRGISTFHITIFPLGKVRMPFF
jgi:C1A family cysteine protease